MRRGSNIWAPAPLSAAVDQNTLLLSVQRERVSVVTLPAHSWSILKNRHKFLKVQDRLTLPGDTKDKDRFDSEGRDKCKSVREETKQSLGSRELCSKLKQTRLVLI